MSERARKTGSLTPLAECGGRAERQETFPNLRQKEARRRASRARRAARAARTRAAKEALAGVEERARRAAAAWASPERAKAKSRLRSFTLYIL